MCTFVALINHFWAMKKSKYTILLKTIRFMSIVAVLFFTIAGCKKQEEKQEIKEWKSREGTYNRNESFVIHESPTWLLSFDQVSVNSSGITLYSRANKQMPSINFDVLQKKNNDNPKYEYKLRYSSLLSIQIGEDGSVTNPQIDRNLFIANREFYLSFRNENTLIFTIVDQGKITNLDFVKS